MTSELSLLRWLGLLSMVARRIAGRRAKGHQAAVCLQQHLAGWLHGTRAGLGYAAGTGRRALHLVNHAMFKSLLFLNAGAVEYATGTRKLKEAGRAEPRCR